MAPGGSELDDEDGSGPGWLVRHPVLSGIIAGVAGALILGLMLPPAGSSAVPEDAMISVAAKTIQSAPVAVAQTPKTDLGAAPAPSVPIVAEAAIVIADTGLNRRVAETIDKTMPRDATLAISVYATDPTGTAAAFKASGRDVWLQVAAQSVRGGIDPGPLAVSNSMSTKDNLALLKRQVAMAGGNVVGIFIPDDADITGGDPDMWRDIGLDLIGSNLMILDATPSKVATTLYMQKSEAQISAYLKTDVIVSGDMGPVALQKALADAIPIILKEQQAIVVLDRPTILAVQTLSSWLKTFGAKGIRLVPATKFTGLKG